MSSPTPLLLRNLTFHFARAVVVTGGQQIPQTMEVSITPLASPSSPSAQLTYVGGPNYQTVLLSGADNTLTFELVPSNAPGLTGTLNYMAAWRQGGVTGATNTQVFSMPDLDCDWDQLPNLGALTAGTQYVQTTNLGKPGGIALLNQAGLPVDSEGDAVAMPTDVSATSAALTAEVVARLAAENSLNQSLSNSITEQTDLTLNAAKAYTDDASETFTVQLGNETGERENADTTLQSNITSGNTNLQNQINTIDNNVSGLTTEIAAKADLDGTGHVPMGQIPSAAITHFILVANTAAMTALQYPSQVHPGDVALTPTAIYLLTTTDPSQLGNWRILNDVLSVNGYTGAVTLTAADVGAVAATNGSLLMTQVTGLSTALSLLASAASVSALQTALTAIQNDTTYVHTTAGVISDAVLPANIALISSAGNITTKNGSVVAIGEGSGVSSVNGKSGAVTLTAADVNAVPANGTITEGQVTGLTTDLGNRVLTTDSRLTNARTPTAHASTHGVSGTDAVTLDPSQVTGLNTTLTTHTNEISSLDTRVTSLEASGPGGYGAGTGIYFAASAATGSFTTDVTLHSPFGFNPTNPHANGAGYYMDPAGAAATDVVLPYITVAGVLAFNKWGSGNTADPYYATASGLSALTTTVAGKANQTDLTALQTTVAGCATAASVNSLSAAVAQCALETDLQSLQVTVATKANQSDLTTTNSTVATKANQSDMTTAQTNITTLQNAMPTKADLVGGVLRSSEVPTNIPLTSINGLTNYLTHMAPGGTFDASALTNVANIPPIAMAAITNLITTLAAKADLSGPGGTLLPSQLPALALTDVFTVSTQAAMLALSTAHAGDICVITQGANLGTYILASTPASTLANWVQLQFPTGAVSSVNGQSGTVVLSWTDVGAQQAGASIPISQVQNLQSTLNSLATTSALNNAIATVTTPAAVQSMMSSSTEFKQTANYVANSPIASLSGQQSVDGVLTPIGSVVLATAQSSSVNNGLWVVNNGAWTRTTDYATGSWLVRGTVVVVTQGTNYANTLWQETATSGFIDTAASTWLNIGSVAPPQIYTKGNGLNLVGNQFSAQVISGGGVTSGPTGLAVDPAVVVRKTGGTVPSTGSAQITLTHNLNTLRPIVQIIDAASGNGVDLGWTVSGANTVSVEFGSAPASGQYNWVAVG